MCIKEDRMILSTIFISNCFHKKQQRLLKGGINITMKTLKSEAGRALLQMQALMFNLAGRIAQGAQVTATEAAKVAVAVLNSYDPSKHLVYLLVDKVNAKVYVGRTGNPSARITLGGYNHQGNIKYALIDVKNLFDRFIFIPVKVVESIDDARKAEAELIKKFKATDTDYGYNVWNRDGQLQESSSSASNNAYNTTKYLIEKTKKGNLRRQFSCLVRTVDKNGKVRYRRTLFSSVSACVEATGDSREHVTDCWHNGTELVRG